MRPASGRNAPGERGSALPTAARLSLPAVLLVGGLVLGAAVGLRPAAPGAGLALEVRDLDDGARLVRTVPLDASGSFTLVFTHSMYGGAVAEAFRVVPEPAPRLQRSTVRTETGGAAEYYARSGNFRQDGDGWLVQAPRLEVDRLPLRVDRTGRPLLRVGDRDLPLLADVPDGHLVELRPVVLARHFDPEGRQ